MTIKLTEWGFGVVEIQNDVLESEETVLEDVPSSETVEVENADYTELVEQTVVINQQLSTLTNISIVVMIGVAIVVGIIANSIYSRYVKS